MAKTVLIVEDDEPTQKLLGTLMMRSGIDSVLATNGAAAIDTLDERDDIACIILDLMMPDVDGYAVLDHVAASGRDVPVVVCTATSGHGAPRFDDRIVRAVVRKPFDIDQLMAIVSALIGSTPS